MLRHFTSQRHRRQRSGHGIKKTKLYIRGAQQVEFMSKTWWRNCSAGGHRSHSVETMPLPEESLSPRPSLVGSRSMTHNVANARRLGILSWLPQQGSRDSRLRESSRPRLVRWNIGLQPRRALALSITLDQQLLFHSISRILFGSFGTSKNSALDMHAPE